MNEDPLLGGTVWMKSPTANEVAPVPQRLYQQRLQEGWKPEPPESKPQMNTTPELSFPAPMKLGGPMAGEDLGGLIPGGGQGGEGGAPPSSSGGTWTDWVTKNKPFLLGLGTQLMAGGTSGSLLGDIGRGVSKGLESNQLTEETNYSRREAEQARQDKLAEGAANRASHEKIGQMGADSRQEVAQIRSEAMLQRAALIHGPQNNQEMKIYSDAANQYIKAEKANQILSKKSDDQIRMEADAIGKERLKGARESTGVRSQGGALPSGSTDTPPEAGNPSGAPAATPGKTATPAQSGQKVETNKDKPSWEQIQKSPAVQRLLASPAGRETLKKERPDLANQIDAQAELLKGLSQPPGM